MRIASILLLLWLTMCPRGDSAFLEEGGGVPITSYFDEYFPLFLISFQGFSLGLKTG